MEASVKRFEPESDKFARQVHTIISASARVAAHMFKTRRFRVTVKEDGSRVTDIDLAVNRILILKLATAFPEIGFLSEETGEGGRPDLRWIIDPIDDTENLIRGLPGWNIIVALQVDDRVELGICCCPTTGRTIMAMRDRGCYMSDTNFGLTRVADYDTAHAAIVAPAGLLRKYPQTGPTIFGRFRKASHFGSFENMWQLLTGKLDAVIAGGGAIWDIAAYSLIIKEAGGRFSDFAGADRIDSRTAIYSNGHLHDAILAHFAEETHPTT